MESLLEDDEEKYKRQFSKFLSQGIKAEELEDMYKDAHAAIRADPSAKKSEKFKYDPHAKVKSYKKARLNLKQRKNKVAQKKAYWHKKNEE